jgi:hypothetical protein
VKTFEAVVQNKGYYVKYAFYEICSLNIAKKYSVKKYWNIFLVWPIFGICLVPKHMVHPVEQWFLTGVRSNPRGSVRQSQGFGRGKQIIYCMYSIY